MFGHLGAKVGEQERKMRRMSEKVGFLEACRGGGAMQVLAENLGYPPLRIAKGTAGAPPGGFGYQLKKLRLRLSTDQVTQQVPNGGGYLYIQIYTHSLHPPPCRMAHVA